MKHRIVDLRTSVELDEKQISASFYIKHQKCFLKHTVMFYLVYTLFILFFPISVVAAEDNLHIMPLDNNDIHNEQHIIKRHQPKFAINHVQGIPVAVSFPKGDYQWLVLFLLNFIFIIVFLNKHQCHGLLLDYIHGTLII